MKTWIALLRAVNLGSHNKIGMAALRDFAAKLGFDNPRTLLQSGNLVFNASSTAAKLEAQLEREAMARLGLGTEFFVRDAKEWSKIVARNPFEKEAKADPAHLVVVCMKDAPKAAAVTALKEAVEDLPEYLEIDGREAYIVYPEGIGRSKLSKVPMEKILGTRGTARNWNTVLKLEALAAS